MTPVTWNPYEQHAVGAYRRKRSLRVRAVVLLVAVAVAVVVVVVFCALFAPSLAVGVGSTSDFELRDFLVENRSGVDRAEWIQR
jgi:hypothetical protein